jgi:prepilin-type N-terminal cleavage/methylation domain-containing protein
MHIKDTQGLSLIELLVVVAVIGILSMIAIPTYIGVQKRHVSAEAKSNLLTLRLLEEQFYSENSNYTANLADVSAIKSAMPGFKPGEESKLSFSYAVEQNKDISGNAQTPCFRATATGKTGSKVQGDVLRIDCNNNRSF